MDLIVAEFSRAIKAQDGYALAATLSPVPPRNDSGRLYALRRTGNPYSASRDFYLAVGSNPNCKLDHQEQDSWASVYTAYLQAVLEILNAEEAINAGKTSGIYWNKVYDAWKSLLDSLIKGYQHGSFAAWTIPCLYMTGKYLRIFAIKADAAAEEETSFQTELEESAVDGGNKSLEDCARQLNRVFGLCTSDRAPISDSRKWGLYYIANLLFKTYFKLNSVSLTKNTLLSLEASVTDMPPLSAFPKSHRVTFNYYVGVISFLDESYVKAEEQLTAAYVHSLANSPVTTKLILTYLIPTRLVTSGVLPTEALLAPYPALQKLFAPIASCIKKGDLAGFDAALQAGEDEFTKRRIYLTLERGRDVCMRNLFRKVFLAGGFEVPKPGQPQGGEQVRRTRIPLSEFAAALRIGGETEVEGEEVECLVAGLIYKGSMKGYISRPHQMVVLNKKGAFPGTGV